MKRWLGPVLLLAVCAHDVAAQQIVGPPPPPPAMNDFHQLLGQNKVMPALELLERIIETHPTAHGSAAQWWTLSGDVERADELFVHSFPRSGEQRSVDLSQVRPEPAVEAIVRAAAGRRIVMINEAHHSPRHRAFTHKVMLALRQAGFTLFAAETFCNTCQQVLTDGAPTRGSGTYTMEPVFGDLARQAGAAGYKLVGYEMDFRQANRSLSPLESIAEREQAQAQNLKAILDANPAARVLVHVGFGHLNETFGSTAMFAARLRQLTGEDPLTIDQIEGTRQYSAEYDSGLHQSFLAAFGEPTAPVAIANNQDRPLGNYSVDLSVIHPAQHAIDGRPDWLAMDGYRKPYQVALPPLGERSLIRAFVEGEPEFAVPMDQLMVGPEAEAATLMLPVGSYRLVRQTEDGEDLQLGQATVQ